MTKRCYKCGEVKDVAEFSKCKAKKDGLQTQCKTCEKAYNAANRERKSEYMKAYNTANRERKSEYMKAYNAANRERNSEYSKAWYAANRERRAESKNAWYRNRRRTDPSYRLVCNMRKAVSTVVRGASKSCRTMEAVGCSIEELWVWLEGQFKDGMTRENYGSFWHVDHFFPLSKTNQADPVQFLASWNYRNLRPEYGDENNLKKDKVFPEAQALFGQLVEEFRGQEQNRRNPIKRVRPKAVSRSRKRAGAAVA